MIKLSMKVGGRTVQPKDFAKALQQQMRRQVEDTIRRKANAAGVSLTKTSDGFTAKGSPEAIGRLKQRSR